MQKACDQLLRSSRWPLIFASHEADRREWCSEAVRMAVRAAMRHAAASTFEDAGFHVRINHEQSGLPKRFQTFGECGDLSCTCNRLTYPWVRRKFKSHVLAHLAGHRADTLHIASLGSGCLLADLEIICALLDAGYSIASATFVDTAYATPHSVQWEALSCMATFLGENARVAAYDSTVKYSLARLLSIEPPASLCLQIDVSAIRAEEFQAVAAVALAPEGVCLRLDNPPAPASATVCAWRLAEPVGYVSNGSRVPLANDVASEVQTTAAELSNSRSVEAERLAAVHALLTDGCGGGAEGGCCEDVRLVSGLLESAAQSVELDQAS